MLARRHALGRPATTAPGRPAVTPGLMAGMVALAALPDLMQGVPVAAWALTGGTPWRTVWDFAIALPGAEPALPPAVAFWSHHLHCAAHSALVAGAVSALSLVWLRLLWLPLWGWWSHIVIDVFTHSAEFYPVPVLYPLTYAGFDGIAWNTPWFQALNYATLALTAAWLWRTRRRG